MSAMLVVRNLKVVAGVATARGIAAPATIVDDVSFSLEKGKVLGLIGESGAGKSTIGLAMMAYGRGNCRIVGGEVRFDGVDLLSLPRNQMRQLRGHRIAYVAQSALAAFNPAKRIGEQITEAAINSGDLSRAAAAIRAKELFRILSLPDSEAFGDKFPHQVSGGQLQRAMIAMALCPGPDLVIFDEPTTALDVTTQIDVLVAIKRALQETQAMALYITHDLAVVAQVADEIMVLRHGKMVEHESTKQIIEAPRQEYTRRLLSLSGERKQLSTGSAKPLLSIEGLDASYGWLPILHGVTMHVPNGQTLAVVGESGSGKSTVARVVAGLLAPTSGSVVFDGQRLSPRLAERSSEQTRALQMIFQSSDMAMNPHQTVRQMLGRPLERYFKLRGSEKERRTIELLDQIELGVDYIDRFPAELSGGQKQRVCIARALAAEPRLIICDEPTSALDPLVAEGILKLMMRLQKETSISYLFITHDIATVNVIADLVAVMHHGRIARFGPRDRVFEPPLDDYTKLLLSSAPEMRLGWLESAVARRGDRPVPGAVSSAMSS